MGAPRMLGAADETSGSGGCASGRPGWIPMLWVLFVFKRNIRVIMLRFLFKLCSRGFNVRQHDE